MLSVLVTAVDTTSADELLKFDVPATCKAMELEQLHSGQKIVEIVVPVSLNLATDSKISIREFQIEIQWNQGAYQITNYQPRTTMQSNIVGTIKVEDRKDTNTSAGLDISSGYFDSVVARQACRRDKKKAKQ